MMKINSLVKNVEREREEVHQALVIAKKWMVIQYVQYATELLGIGL